MKDNTTEGWEQRANDNEDITDAADALSDLKLNVNAVPFVPGQNVFAREFVPVPNAEDNEDPKGILQWEEYVTIASA